MIGELKSLWDGHQTYINVAKYQVVLVIDDIKPVPTTIFYGGSTPRKFAAADIS